ncbi:hypothetical protein PRNP1_014306 [Phytophthora ramorum]
MATTHSPMHSLDYPLGDEVLNAIKLAASIDTDLATISKYYTHARAYYSQYYGIPVTQYAAKNNVKLHLGVFMTSESSQSAEIDCAVAAVQNYPGTVAAILVGNENLMDGVKSADILSIVFTIKSRLGAMLAATVKFGTVQRITEHLNCAYDTKSTRLNAGLDILGATIYPFFDSVYSANSPTAILDGAWNTMEQKFPASKMSRSTSITQWGAQVFLFFFDRKTDDNSMGVALEKHFGLFTYNRSAESTDPDYPRLLNATVTPATASTTASPTTPAPTAT